MANLLEDKEITYYGLHKLELDNKKVRVYYTDERINKLKRVKDKDEIREIIKNSYLMCQN